MISDHAGQVIMIIIMMLIMVIMLIRIMTLIAMFGEQFLRFRITSLR